MDSHICTVAYRCIMQCRMDGMRLSCPHAKPHRKQLGCEPAECLGSEALGVPDSIVGCVAHEQEAEEV